MPEYQIKYTVDNANAVKGINELLALINRLDKAVDTLKPKLKNIASGVAPGMRQTATATNQLSAKMASATTQAEALRAALQLNGAAAAVGQVATAAQGLGGSLQASGTQGASLGTTLLGFTGATAILSAVRMGVGEIGQAFDDAREYAEEVTKETLHLRDAVRELRATMGENVTAEEATEEVKNLMIKSTAKQEEAVAFSTAFASTVPAAREKGNWGLNESETEEFKAEALKLGVKNDINSRTMGEMSAMIGIGEKITSVKQAMGKLATMTKLFADGVGSMSDLGKVYEKIRGEMVREDGGGMFRNSEEVAAVVSTDSVDQGNPGAITNKVKQVALELSFAKETNEAKKKTLADWNIGPHDDYVDRVRSLHKFVTDVEKDPTKNIYAELEKAGFKANERHAALIQAAHEYPLLEKKMLEAGRVPNWGKLDAAGKAKAKEEAAARLEKRGEEAMDANEAFIGANPHRQAEAALTVARIDRGDQEKRLLIARKAAEAKLTREGRIDTPGSNFVDTIHDLGGLNTALGGLPHKEKIKDYETVDAIMRVAPSTVAKHPELELHGQIGLGNNTAISGDTLKAILNTMPAREFNAVMNDLNGVKPRERQLPAARKGGIPAAAAPAAQAPAMAPGGPGVGGMPGRGAIPGGAGEAQGLRVLQQILDETKKGNQIMAQRQAQLPNGGGAVQPGRS